MNNWQGVIQGYKEHNEMLMKMVKERGDESTRLREENARLREALKDIASEGEWETVDEARNIARRALEGESDA